MKLSELTTFGAPGTMKDAKLSVFFKGHSGSGKTRAALTFPDPIKLLYTDVNRETVRKMVDGGVKVDGIIVQSWSEYSDVIVPNLANRKVEAETIVLDTVDFLSELMWRDIEGSRGKLTMQDFGTGLRRLSETTKALVSCTMPLGDHPGYHVVFTSHLKDQTNDSGALLRVAPAIMGQFANKIEDYFDYVLLLQGETASKIEQVAGQPKNVKSKQFKVHSVAPDKYHTCKGGGMPAEFIVPEGASAFEVMNEFWKVGKGPAEVTTKETK